MLTFEGCSFSGNEKETALVLYLNKYKTEGCFLWAVKRKSSTKKVGKLCRLYKNEDKILKQKKNKKDVKNG